MGIFFYTVKSKQGKIVKGELQAESESRAIEYLHGQGAIILSLKEGKAKKSRPSKRRGIKTDELVVFSRQLTTLIESAISVVGALDILYHQITNPSFKEIIESTLKDLREGSSFAAAISKYPQVFPEIYVSMVEAAETSGNLPEILERLSVYLEKSSALHKKIIFSLTYPVVVIFMAIAITGFLVFKVVPTFKGIFAMLGGQLPLPTRILIGFSDILTGKQIFYPIVASIVLFIVSRKYISTSRGRKNYHRLLLKLPIAGEIIRKVSIVKFAQTFSTLIKSGVSIVSSLNIVGKTSGNKIIEEAVEGAKRSIEEGAPLSQPLEESGIFPPMVIKMIEVGEKTGKLESMLSKIAQFYEGETEAIISGLTSLIEPLVIGFLGIIIGGIVVALFLPIIQITRLVGG